MADSKPAAPKPSAAKTSMGAPWLLGLVGGLLGLGVMVGLILAQGNKAKTTNTTNTGNSSLTVNDNLNTTVNENTNVPVASSDVWTVNWNEPAKVDSFRVLPKLTGGYDPEQPNVDDASSNAQYYKVGTVTSGDYNGDSVFLISFFDEGPALYPTFFHVIRHDTTSILLKKESDQNYYEAEMKAAGTTIDDQHGLAGLNFPETLQGPEPRQTLVGDRNVNSLFDPNGMTKVFTDPTYGAVYTKIGDATDAELPSLTRYTLRNGFYLEAPDGTVRVYALEADIFEKTADREMSAGSNGGFTIADRAKITWTDGTANTSEYIIATFGGCGASNYANVVTDTVKLTDLKKTGTTAQGDSIYEWKDAQAERLTNYYENTYQAGEGQKISFDDFVAHHPLIYWTDPFGRLIELTNNDYRLLAECGKPVIYLYPTHTQAVHVDLQPQGGFTKSVPAYNGGWNVIARPDGTLINQADGATYPNLFWEGRGGIYQTPEPGFVVTQSNIHGFLKESLGQLGLNGKETNDFIDFWEPRMQGSPYYFVTFAGNAIMNQLAPLTITPPPDTTIRILMDFQPLDRPIATTPLHLTAPVRRGFTVVEWGGVLR